MQRVVELDIAAAEARLVIALDMPGSDAAYAFCKELNLPRCIYKVGLELLFAGGIGLIRKLSDDGFRVFADTKLFDIGHTVERAAAQIARSGAEFATVHVHDDRIARAAARGAAGSQLKLLGVTILTDRPVETGTFSAVETVTELIVSSRAGYAAQAGFYGVVSSAAEAAVLKSRHGNRLAVFTPGIRTSGFAIEDDDQARTATPADAIRAGADYIVVGRPISRAADPALSAREIVAEIAEALASA